MIGKVIHSLLTNDVAVTDLVGDKVFPIIHKQGTPFPSVTYEIISTEPMEVIGWEKIADNIEVQINIFSESYKNAIEIKEAIKAVLDYKNQFVSEGIKFCGIEPTNDMDGTYNKELNLFHKVLQYTFYVNT